MTTEHVCGWFDAVQIWLPPVRDLYERTATRSIEEQLLPSMHVLMVLWYGRVR